MSEPAVIGLFCIRKVLPIKLESVEESRQHGVRNWVLCASGFVAALKGGCVGLEACIDQKYIWRGDVSRQSLAERGKGEGTGEGPQFCRAPCQGAVANCRDPFVNPPLS